MLNGGSFSVKNSKAEVAERAYRLAYEYESKYGNCPQCVIAAVSEVLDLQIDDVFKAGHALAGGVGLAGDGTCGALSGGVMAISYKHGRERKDFTRPRHRRLKSYFLAKELHDRFVEEFGSCICKDIQKKIFGRSFNLWDAEDYEKFKQMGGHTDKCTDVAGKAAKWTTEILIRESATE